MERRPMDSNGRIHSNFCTGLCFCLATAKPGAGVIMV
jgi:hypothetical protein